MTLSYRFLEIPKARSRGPHQIIFIHIVHVAFPTKWLFSLNSQKINENRREFHHLHVSIRDTTIDARTDRNQIDWEMFQNLGENSCLPSLPISRWSARTRSGHAQQVAIKALLQFVLWTKARDMLGNVLEKNVKTNDTTLRNLTTHSHLSCWKENLWNICFICGKVPTQWKSGKSETHKTEPSAKTNEKKKQVKSQNSCDCSFQFSW